MTTHVKAAGETTLTVLCSNGLKAVAEELLPQFERATKHKVVVRYGLAAALKQQIERGEPFDVAFVTPGGDGRSGDAARLQGHARHHCALGAGDCHPRRCAQRDISTVDAFKRALLDAKGIAYARKAPAASRSPHSSSGSASRRR